MRYPLVATALAVLLTALVCNPVLQAAVMGNHASKPPIPPPSPETLTAVQSGTTAFTVDLYKAATKNEQENVVMSPFSLSMILAMVAAGANGKTLKEFEEVLKVPHKPDLHAAVGQLRKALLEGGGSGSPTLLVANKIWLESTCKVQSEFQQLSATFYGVEPALTDFRQHPEEGRKSINSWVSDQTQAKIRDLLLEGSVDETTAMVLANAIFFKGQWETAFDAAQTQKGPFKLLSGESKDVPFMRATGKYQVAEKDNFMVLELPYRKAKGEARDLAMTFVLPKEEEGLPDLEKELSPELLSDMSTRELSRVDVVLPKFKVVFTLPATQILQQLGLKLAFDDQADFSNLLQTPTGEPIGIKTVAHKAFVEVNEQGTEAAAASAAVVNTRSLQLPVEFKADHPFLFLIKDRATQTILFVGRVMDPSTEEA